MKFVFKLILSFATSIFPAAFLVQTPHTIEKSMVKSDRAIVKKNLSADITGNIGTFDVDVPNNNAILASAKNKFPNFHNEGSG
jgi:hypothetical protein